jgi:2'-5' RNA ligase
MMRIFIAIEIPQNIRVKIAEITDYLQSKTPPTAVKWVDSENLHLTIKFIGETVQEKIEEIAKVLNQSLLHQAPFSLEISGLGMYPNNTNPRVIWLGVTGGEPLIAMHNMLDQKLASLGIQREGRPFSPHLTIARLRRNTDTASIKRIGKTLSQFRVDSLGLFNIDHVQLFQSVLTPSGPIYTTLFSVPLNQV